MTNNVCKCSGRANKECVLQIHAGAGYEIVDGYYVNLDEPSWRDIKPNMPEVADCIDFIRLENKEAGHD
ncbi:MAG: hypothetical protein LBH43_00635 [Treponema sp.]|jgi:hypothetical protein|nr:hypothetical protein [Treponema sp.]